MTPTKTCQKCRYAWSPRVPEPEKPKECPLFPSDPHPPPHRSASTTRPYLTAYLTPYLTPFLPI